MSAPTDPLNFIPADVFYTSVPSFQTPGQVRTVLSSDSTDKSDPRRFAAQIYFNASDGDPGNGTNCLVQFVTPQIWRIRYNPKFQDTDYPDANSRTIVMNSFAELVDSLQEEYRESKVGNTYETKPGWFWKTTFQQPSSGHWILSSVDFSDENPAGIVNTRLHFLADPVNSFRIVATRQLSPMKADVASASLLQSLGVTPISPSEQIVWQTTGKTFAYQGDKDIGVINNVVLKVNKPEPAAYLGFGEHGGRTVLKKPTYMNYFCYDNFNYHKVYGQGALDSKEPLYHSSPFYLEMNGTPDYRNVTGMLVDNYSQVAIDLGMGNSSTVGVATRFGTFDAYIMTADDVPKMIWQYTSIVGRAKLKPRFILGHHQGCYGYDSDDTVTGIVNGYRWSGTPLDGMHIDVDLQVRWPCANGISLLVCDNRYTEGLPSVGQQCTRYDGGYAQPTTQDPNNLQERIWFADYPGAQSYSDNYEFNPGNYNSGYPFHGGVSYGPELGTPGYYPDLNRAIARKVWGQQYQYLFENGLEFVWQDMTTPSIGTCYGDMLGFPSRLLMSDDVYDQDPKVKPPTKTAIELLALYSYNLHKATYHGLNNLACRQNKRNFIIGRGSLTGMHRYAGLWTGDNGSSWDFWRISVAQVLALGYSGLTIAGVDMGGFTFDPNSNLPPPRWCDPELLIRWYSGAFLLPWYRNHYNQHFNTKVFQEPWQYTNVLKGPNAGLIADSQKTLYASVEPICRYYVKLRYSLIQVLYDTMFANLTNGLPIARAMLITDPDDTTLFNANDNYIDTQYLLGHNILVCPVLHPSVSYRNVYLPGSDLWFPSNLQIDEQNLGEDPQGLMHATMLGNPVEGGTTIRYFCGIPDGIKDPTQIAYVTPVYIRGGAIIPQIRDCQYIGEIPLNPPMIHIYPGKANQKSSYSMFLDDGVSRDSAPAYLPQYKYSGKASEPKEAKSLFRELLTTNQDCAQQSRNVKLFHAWDGYDASSTVGDTYNLAIWAVASTAGSGAGVNVTIQDETGKTLPVQQPEYNAARSVLLVNVPVALVPSLAGPLSGTPSPTTPPSVADKYVSITVTGLD
ncbi:glycosyl hydrolases family 31-domain-containing protein [Thelonectria olida]|uniref:alpha-glucosidase n=1 Tax=Thelonectria olida TaxID=1576542 RepID=A0A9P8VRQ8_9HYPO|nr:glycosyl hydrolases family 31-domain-containing protein [Thelonectria olida]